MARDKEPAAEWEPSTWDELFPGRFLKHGHLKGPTELIIERVVNTLIDGKLAQLAKIGPVPGIEQREWGLNKTNGILLRAMFGDSVRADWPGKRVVVQPSKVEHGREKGKPCIRVCGSPDIAQDMRVVVDFHTTRIKPFTVTLKRWAPAAEPSAKARELAALYRAASTVQELVALQDAVEDAMSANEISGEAATSLMNAISKRAADLTDAQKDAANVIT